MLLSEGKVGEGTVHAYTQNLGIACRDASNAINTKPQWQSYSKAGVSEFSEDLALRGLFERL